MTALSDLARHAEELQEQVDSLTRRLDTNRERDEAIRKLMDQASFAAGVLLGAADQYPDDQAEFVREASQRLQAAVIAVAELT